eukprot:gene10871-7536_t
MWIPSLCLFVFGGFRPGTVVAEGRRVDLSYTKHLIESVESSFPITVHWFILCILLLLLFIIYFVCLFCFSIIMYSHHFTPMCCSSSHGRKADKSFLSFQICFLWPGKGTPQGLRARQRNSAGAQSPAKELDVMCVAANSAFE